MADESFIPENLELIMDEILAWEDIKEQFHDGLILGNGASTSVSNQFSYESLFEAARSRNHITQEVREIFDAFQVNDFEFILRRLWQAQLVNKALRVQSEKIDHAYVVVQAALIKTIRECHPSYEQIKDDLQPIYEFMKQFNTVISLNYDLIVYWAMGLCSKDHGNWFKDGFINGIFDEDIEKLRRPHRAEGATLVFYPHGNIIIGRTEDGNEKKLQTAEDNNLLETIFSCWKDDSISPIFVCEGTTEHKKIAISNAAYLQRVYHEFIPSITNSLVIYGWSFPDQDQHILEQLEKADFTRVAVSVYGDNQEYITNVHKKLKKFGMKEIMFFDADSPSCWKHPPLDIPINSPFI